MNENLVRRLRRLEAEHKKEWGGATEESCLIAEAADVIKTLSAQNGIIRCRECVHGRFKHQDMYECLHDADIDENTGVPYGFIDYHEPDFFCAHGERRTENEDPKAD